MSHQHRRTAGFLVAVVLGFAATRCGNPSVDLAGTNSALSAGSDALDGARFRAAAKCGDCDVLTVARVQLPRTGVRAATAKLRTSGGAFAKVTLRDDGSLADEATLFEAETIAKGGGKTRPDLETWSASTGTSTRRWVWIWTTAAAGAVRREELLASASAAKAHTKSVQETFAASRSTVQAWLDSRAIEQGDRGGPMLRALLSASDVRELAKLSVVVEMGLDSYPGKREGAPWSTTSEWGPTLRLDGAHLVGVGLGAKVCVKEDTRPDTYARLSVAATANPAGPTSSHTRAAAGILRNTDASAFPWLSVAPSASVYIGNWAGFNGAGGVDAWCAAQGTTTLSYSYSVLGAAPGPLGGTDMAHDWLAIQSPYMLVVAAAGERDTSISNGWYVRNRGYNGLVVGGMSDNNTAARNDDAGDTASAYGNPTTPHNDYELPHVSAPSNGADGAGATLNGTSGGTAMVAGIGSLIDAIDPGLAGWPEAKRAIIIATAVDRPGEGLLTSLPAPTDTRLGAGVVNAEAAATLAQTAWAANAYGATTVAARGRLARTVSFGSDFDGSGYLTARWKAHATITGRLRAVITFDATPSCAGGNCTSDTPDADLDLHLFKKTDGTWTTTGPLACASSTYDSTWELCDIPVVAGEDYLIAVRKWSTVASQTYLGVAWQNYAVAPAMTNEGSSILPVAPYWETEVVGNLSSATSLEGKVKNSTGSTISGSLVLVSRGFDGRTATRTLIGSLTLAPYEIRSVPVPVGNLPIKSVGTEATAELVVTYTTPTGTRTVPSHPVFYQFQSGLGTADFFGGKVNPATWSPNNAEASFISLSHALFSYEGVVLNDAGTYDPIAVVRGGDPPSDGGRPAKTEGITGVTATILNPSGSVAVETPAPNTVRICTTWKARFVDSGAEDYYASSSADIPARYAHVNVLDTDYHLQWSGHLSSSGCTPYLSLPVGNYVLWQEPRMYKGGAVFDVRYERTPLAAYRTPESTVVTKGLILLTGFERTASTSAATIQLRPTVSEQITTVSGIVSTALVTSTDIMIMPGVEYGFNTHQRSFSGADAATSSEMWLYSNDIKGYAHNAYFKFVVGHEMGHLMQNYAFGFPDYSYTDTDGDRVDDADEDENGNGIKDGDEDAGGGLVNREVSTWIGPIVPRCSCQHVTGAVNKHCMNGREEDGAGRNEGFAHAFGARIWNNWTESNCSFTYYKESYLVPTAGADSVEPVGYSLSCKGPVKSIGWEKSYCLGTNTAVEHDWLNYQWELLTAPAAEASTFTSLADIYRRACAKSALPTTMLCKSNVVHFKNDSADAKALVWAAKQVYGPLSPKLDFLLNQATSFGVDH